MDNTQLRDRMLRAKHLAEQRDGPLDLLPTRLFTREHAAVCREALRLYGDFIRQTLPTKSGYYELSLVRGITSTFPTHVPYDYTATRSEVRVIFRALVYISTAYAKTALGRAAYGLYQSWRNNKFAPPGSIGNNRRANAGCRYTVCNLPEEITP